MLSLELSVFDIALTVAVSILMILFVSLLLKLRPSNENNQVIDKKAFEKEPRQVSYPFQPSQQQMPHQNQSFGAEQFQQRTDSQKSMEAPPQILVSAATGSASEESLEQASPSPKESARQSEPREVSMWNPNNSKSKDCPHEFGYLSGLPKNRPIPGECFGCEKIVDCLVNKKSK